MFGIYTRLFVFSVTVFVGVKACLRGKGKGKPKGQCNDIEIVTREEWGARPPKERYPIDVPTDLMFVHHTAGNSCTDKESCMEIMRAIQDFHMDDRGWFDIGYSFLVGEDGRVYEGRGWGIEGGHTRCFNTIAHAVSVMGNFNNRLPNEAALDATKKIIECGIEEGHLSRDYRLYGHRDAKEKACPTDCPGHKLYGEIKKWNNFCDPDKLKKCC